MPRYAAFIRGINLGSTRKISGTELRGIFEDAGFDEVNTFRNSGNVAFEGERSSASKLAAKIEKAIAKEVGFEAIAFVRTAKEIEAIAEHQPFPKRRLDASKGKLQVILLGGKPPAAVRKKAEAAASDEDRLAFGSRELYWLPSGGIMDAAIGMKDFDEMLGPNTMRTKGTIEQLVAKYIS